MDAILAFLTAPVDLWLVVVVVALALLFLGLWLRARGGAGGGAGDADARTQLRAAQNEVRLLKGDAIQTKRDHAEQVEKLNKELETLRAVAGGRVPPELEEWKKRAVAAEEQVKTMRERHRAEIEKISAAVGGGGGAGGGVDRTVIAPGGVRERMESLERDLAETKKTLQAATEAHKAELAALSERLNAEKAAALTAQGRRHAAELEAARRGAASGVVADRPAAAAPLGVDPLAAPPPAGVTDRARFPLLQALAGADKGTRFHLPYDAATIGRSDGNTVVIQEGAASRTHAEIRFDGRDFVLKDQNSTNGTLLNGQLVASAPLNFGDVIAIGETQLRFTCEAAEATDPAFAERAYEAMIQLAPSCRPALRGLGRILESDPNRREEAQAVAARLQEIERGGIGAVA